MSSLFSFFAFFFVPKYSTTILLVFSFIIGIHNTQVTGCDTTTSNLISNGNFSLGFSDFDTDYYYAGTTLWGTATFGIAPSNPYNCPLEDHTNGTNPAYFFADGSTSGEIPWRSLNNIPIVPGGVYRFQAYIATIFQLDPGGGGTPRLNFQISTDNMVTWTSLGVTTDYNTSGCPGWTYVANDYLAPSGVTTANIRLVNAIQSAYGNDFAVDDIYFGLYSCAPGANQLPYIGPTFTATGSATASSSANPSTSATNSAEPTNSAGPTVSAVPSTTASASPSASASSGPSVTGTRTTIPTLSSSSSASASASSTITGSNTRTPSSTPSPSASSSIIVLSAAAAAAGDCSSKDENNGSFYCTLHKAFNGAYELTIAAIATVAAVSVGTIGYFVYQHMKHLKLLKLEKERNNNGMDDTASTDASSLPSSSSSHQLNAINVVNDGPKRPVGRGQTRGSDLKLKEPQVDVKTNFHNVLSSINNTAGSSSSSSNNSNGTDTASFGVINPMNVSQ